jgi:carboxymethylenebutenolidase
VNDIQRYILEEHVEDFEDGIITRRELLRRVTLITGSFAATMTVLATLGCNLDRPGGTAASPVATTAPPPGVAYATPPSAASTGVTVQPNDPRIVAQTAEVRAPDGAMLLGYLARPKAEGRYAGVVVIHENRGLLEHIKDVTRRVATAGLVGISVDLLSRQGGADRLGDGYSAQLGNRTTDDMVKDVVSALDHLRAQPFVDGTKLGAVGFCFGGGMVWNLLASGADVKAAAPYYGPAPAKIDGLGTQKAAVYAVYAEQDGRITESAPTVEDQLKRSGRPYRIVVYPGVGHAFHNDTGARFNAEQAQKAWVATVDWFKQYLA